MEVGKYNTLQILRGTSVGMYLGDEEGNDVLLPHKYIPENAQIGESIEVFIYRDSEDRLIATTLKPLILLNQFAILEVVAATQFGAFLDWGLEKDLFVPFKEQNHKLQKGQYVPVYLYLDEQTDRVVASAKVHKYFKNLDGVDLEEGQEVDLLVFEKTELGHNVVVNNLYKGLVYENETFRRLAWGDTTKGYVKLIRDEGKIDISLQPLGFLKTLEPNQKAILDKLQQSGGTLNLSDSSDPIEIQEVLEMSKKAFKKAIGVLYKDKKIIIKSDSIVLNQTSPEK
ncbi:CvfB family protein [Lacihabitans soyangensis]|uniref:GntR family transcriptional regulator n=1 Tax=Lacihabitans soyangensis TaxID=869394 RepID=A0AAE3H2D1_9BACT|nr:S1-like domain-containing RNA-binding protein [Lacihabitans soyangensis]MCP9762704.1 GntR family transcriptional regulator [Lacihabitans soyangensis]